MQISSHVENSNAHTALSCRRKSPHSFYLGAKRKTVDVSVSTVSLCYNNLAPAENLCVHPPDGSSPPSQIYRIEPEILMSDYLYSSYSHYTSKRIKSQ